MKAKHAHIRGEECDGWETLVGVPIGLQVALRFSRYSEMKRLWVQTVGSDAGCTGARHGSPRFIFVIFPDMDFQIKTVWIWLHYADQFYQRFKLNVYRSTEVSSETTLVNQYAGPH